MIPLKDENPTTRTPFVTVAIVLACAAVWFVVQQSQPERRRVEVLEQGAEVDVPGDLAFNLEYAAIPCEVVTQEPLDLDELSATFERGDTEACEERQTSPELFPDKAIWMSVVVSMFLHGGLLHLGGNLLFLWIFGNNVEDRLGHVAYLGFYLVGGVVATIAHVAVNADSTVPVVGASGAIAAVMGAYLVWHPNARINTLVMMVFITFVRVRAKWLLGFWLLLQFFTSDNSGVAWVAHVGGFVFGVLFGLVVGPGGRGRRRDRAVLGDPSWSGY